MWDFWNSKNCALLLCSQSFIQANFLSGSWLPVSRCEASTNAELSSKSSFWACCPPPWEAVGPECHESSQHTIPSLLVYSPVQWVPEVVWTAIYFILIWVVPGWVTAEKMVVGCVHQRPSSLLRQKWNWALGLQKLVGKDRKASTWPEGSGYSPIRT